MRIGSTVNSMAILDFEFHGREDRSITSHFEFHNGFSDRTKRVESECSRDSGHCLGDSGFGRQLSPLARGVPMDRASQDPSPRSRCPNHTKSFIHVSPLSLHHSLPFTPVDSIRPPCILPISKRTFVGSATTVIRLLLVRISAHRPRSSGRPTIAVSRKSMAPSLTPTVAVILRRGCLDSTDRRAVELARGESTTKRSRTTGSRNHPHLSDERNRMRRSLTIPWMMHFWMISWAIHST